MNPNFLDDLVLKNIVCYDKGKYSYMFDKGNLRIVIRINNGVFHFKKNADETKDLYKRHTGKIEITDDNLGTRYGHGIKFADGNIISAHDSVDSDGPGVQVEGKEDNTYNSYMKRLQLGHFKGYEDVLKQIFNSSKLLKGTYKSIFKELSNHLNSK